MDSLVHTFLDLIKKVESITGYPIKIVAFDFDCTLIPFHTTGSYQIYQEDGKLKPGVLDKFFPEKEWIQLLIIGLVESGKIPAIASHSDTRFIPPNGKQKGYRGGVDLILPLVDSLLPGDLFKTDNVIAYSREQDGSFKDKNQQIQDLVTGLNMRLKTQYGLENILLIDDTWQNIDRCQGYHSIYSDFKGTGLSLGSKLKDLPLYLDTLDKQLNKQVKNKQGLTILKESIFTLPGSPWMYIVPAIGLVVTAKFFIDKTSN